MNLLEKATDWTNQTNEERAEMCASFLYVHGFLSAGDRSRTHNRIRICADTQRERRAEMGT